MTKKIKTLLALGVVTVVTASSMVPVSASSKDNYKGSNTKGVIYLNINGVKCKFKLNSNCINKPSKPNTNPDNNQNSPGSTEKPNNKPENQPENKPENKPNDNNNNNSGSTEKPENKPNDNNNNNSGSTEKPETNDQLTGNFAAFQKEVTDLVNLERTNIGLKPLKLNEELSNVATIKSQDMINKNYFDHNSPTYGSPFDMMKKFGISYRSAGENIAMGQRTPKEVVTAWMNSEGHRKNILNANFTEIGVGVAKKSNGSIYWTQMFIGR